MQGDMGIGCMSLRSGHLLYNHFCLSNQSFQFMKILGCIRYNSEQEILDLLKLNMR